MGQKWLVKGKKNKSTGALVAFQEIKIMKTFFRLRLIPPQKHPILISGSVYFLDIAPYFFFSFKQGLFFAVTAMVFSEYVCTETSVTAQSIF